MKDHRVAVIRIASTLVLATGLLAASVLTASDVYPRASWEQVESLEQAGWSRTALDEARRYSTTIATAAVMIVVGGQVVDAWGEIDRRSNAVRTRHAAQAATTSSSCRTTTWSWCTASTPTARDRGSTARSSASSSD